MAMVSRIGQFWRSIMILGLMEYSFLGVQEAFEYTNKVMKLSFHKWQPGFFPGKAESARFRLNKVQDVDPDVCLKELGLLRNAVKETGSTIPSMCLYKVESTTKCSPKLSQSKQSLKSLNLGIQRNT